MAGQLNLKDAVDRTIAFEDGGKKYQLRPGKLATLMVRPRGTVMLPSALFAY